MRVEDFCAGGFEESTARMHHKREREREMREREAKGRPNAWRMAVDEYVSISKGREREKRVHINEANGPFARTQRSRHLNFGSELQHWH